MDAQKHVTFPTFPLRGVPFFTDRKKPAISEVGTFERIALHSTFVRGGIRGFRDVVKQNWVAVGGSLKTTTGCAVQKKHGTFPPNMGNSRFLAMVNSTGSGDESLRNKCEFESYLLLLTWSSRHTSSRSPQELSYQTHPLGMSNSCALVPCVIGNKTKETAGYQSVSFLWNWIHWSPRNEGPVKKSSTIFLWNIRSFFVFCPNDQFCCGCV